VAKVDDRFTISQQANIFCQNKIKYLKDNN